MKQERKLLINSLSLLKIKAEIRKRCKLVMNKPLQDLINALHNKAYRAGYNDGVHDTEVFTRQDDS